MLRFAYRPTAELSPEALRTALLTYLAARKSGERFVVRIEDGDGGHEAEKYQRQALEILSLAGLRYDDVTYQSRNLTIHQHMAIRLLGEWKAFACFCPPASDDTPCRQGCADLTDAQVLADERPFGVRLRQPTGRGQRAAEEAGDPLIMRHDKRPTPPFATAVDDMLQDISFLIRPDRESALTPVESAIREALGYDRPVGVFHLPPLPGAETPGGVRQLLEEGFLPEAIANYLIAESLETPRPFFTLEEAAAWFDPARIQKEPAPFDRKKLRLFNRHHLARCDARELSRAFGFADEAVGELAKAHLDSCDTLADLRPRIAAIFAPKPFSGRWEAPMRTLQKALKPMPLPDDFETLRAELAERTGLEGATLELALRRLFTGRDEGPNMAALYPHLKNYLQEIIQ